MTAAIDFASSEDLQTALGRWLEQYGHSVHRQVACPEGGTVDLLTPIYVITCPATLAPPEFWAAVDQLHACRQQFPEQRPVIAGLTPETDWNVVFEIAEQVKDKGIEVWFLDQNAAFVQFYKKLTATPQPKAPGRFSRRNPLTGCLISLGMAAILSGSFWLAYRILDRHQFQVARGSQENRAWEQLHNAVEVWDMDTTQSSLDRLVTSRNPCVAQFAERFRTSLDQQGAEGFRDINPIKRALNMQNGCDLEMREYDFSQ